MAELGPKWEPKREPKWEPKALQDAFRSPRGFKRLPGTHVGSILEPIGLHSDSMLGSFLYNVGLFANEQTCILVQLQAVLFYFYFRHAVCEVAGFGGACPL